MSNVQVGRMFEKQAIPILITEGYKIIDKASKRNWKSIYDFEVEKNGIGYYVEVRGRKKGKCIQYFSFTKKKIVRLGSLDKEVLLLCINSFGYLLFSIKKINKYMKTLKIGDKMINVVTDVSLSTRKENILLYLDKKRGSEEILLICTNEECRYKWPYYKKKLFTSCPKCKTKCSTSRIAKQIVTVGSSLGIIINVPLAKKLKLKKGDWVDVDFEKLNIIKK